MIIEEIKDSLKIAMKSSNKSEVLAIRNILEKIKKFEVDNKLVATENDVQKILSKYAKQLKDSIEQFKNGNRLDLGKKEEAEFNTYIPMSATAPEIEEYFCLKLD